MGLMNKKEIPDGALRVSEPNKILHEMNADWVILAHDYQRNPLHDRIYTSRLVNTNLKQLCINSATEEYNHNLAGDIQKEFEVTQTDVISKVEEELCIHTSRILNQRVKSINVDGLWVNFQQKQEFNPRHSHEGMYSFVFYASIPESIRKEYLKSPSTNTKSRGLIEFCSEYTNDSIIFNPSENNIFIFESSHIHQVYPFYSDETRISIAGNINYIE
jgi:hypothetical protein